MAAILYTSGSTGKPKGVVLSHRNLVTGAESVASYLNNTADDRLLTVLPFSFDYGRSQLTTAFSRGASVALIDYLPPSELDARPDSIGKAIPNAEIMVVREDGTECAANEPGELVHRGTLVTLGYWNDPAKTAERFRPSPAQSRELPIPEIAVWSGDEVMHDEDGYLYFIGRRDEMIKTSGYRVSPTEVEDVLYGLNTMREAVALGLPHPILGQAILALVVVDYGTDEEAILSHCQRELPNFMVPQAIRIVAELPRNQNGKIDRKRLAQTYQPLFSEL